MEFLFDGLDVKKQNFLSEEDVKFLDNWAPLTQLRCGCRRVAGFRWRSVQQGAVPLNDFLLGGVALRVGGLGSMFRAAATCDMGRLTA